MNNNSQTDQRLPYMKPKTESYPIGQISLMSYSGETYGKRNTTIIVTEEVSATTWGSGDWNTDGSPVNTSDWPEGTVFTWE